MWTSAATSTALRQSSIRSCSVDVAPANRVFSSTSTGAWHQGREFFRSTSTPTRSSGSDYFGSGATANSHFYEIAAGSNPSNYKWFVWGINDVCPDWFEEVYPAIYTRSGIPVSGYLSPTYRGALSKAPAWVERVRVDSTANTFAESAPQFDVSQLPEEFQIGADRILTRTTGN